MLLISRVTERSCKKTAIPVENLIALLLLLWLLHWFPWVPGSSTTNIQTQTTHMDGKTENPEPGGKSHRSGARSILKRNVCLCKNRSTMHLGCLEKQLSLSCFISECPILHKGEQLGEITENAKQDRQPPLSPRRPHNFQVASILPKSTKLTCPPEYCAPEQTSPFPRPSKRSEFRPRTIDF